MITMGCSIACVLFLSAIILANGSANNLEPLQGASTWWSYPSCVTPAIASDGTVFVVENWTLLTALQPHGAVSWVVQLPFPATSMLGHWQVSTLIIASSQSVYAYSSVNGTVKWSFQLNYPSVVGNLLLDAATSHTFVISAQMI